MPEILGVRIDSINLKDAKLKAETWLNGVEQKKIFTPNPEMLVLAEKLPHFKEVLNRGDLNLCDGFGITLVSGGKIKRISGSDFIWDLCELAEKNDKSIFLLGTGDETVLLKVKNILNKKFVQLRVVGLDVGPKIEVGVDGIEVDKEANDVVFKKINDSGAQVLIVAFGAVKQEIWIDQFLSNLPNVKLAIGLGGALDYIGGKVKRAPLFLRQIGLEWLYRLIKQPARIKRILNATIKFVFLVIKK